MAFRNKHIVSATWNFVGKIARQTEFHRRWQDAPPSTGNLCANSAKRNFKNVLTPRRVSRNLPHKNKPNPHNPDQWRSILHPRQRRGGNLKLTIQKIYTAVIGTTKMQKETWLVFGVALLGFILELIMVALMLLITHFYPTVFSLK